MNPKRYILLSCEHGGNQIPPEYLELFKEAAADLKCHRGYDPGALDCARLLSEALCAPLVYQEVSRLLIDQNRSLKSRNLFSEFSKNIDETKKKEITDTFYHPYYDQIVSSIEQVLIEGGRILHLSIHTFTPELDGKGRNADIGFLYDPSRADELNFCTTVVSGLHEYAPELRVRRNYPYRGTSDGLVTSLRHIYAPEVYSGVEIELNHRWYFTEKERFLRMCSVLTECVSASVQRS